MKKILVAEDNDSNYVLMTYLLKKDFEYDRANNGKVAVEMVEANNYDLVLMDIKMPIMDGLEATKKIKELKPDLPVVDSDRAAAEEAGCCGFLSKPVNRDECIALLKKVLGELSRKRNWLGSLRLKPIPNLIPAVIFLRLDFFLLFRRIALYDLAPLFSLSVLPRVRLASDYCCGDKAAMFLKYYLEFPQFPALSVHCLPSLLLLEIL